MLQGSGSSFFDRLDLDKMKYLADHSPDLRSIVVDDGVIRTAETESDNRPLLRFYLVNDAARLRNLDFRCHRFSYTGLAAV